MYLDGDNLCSSCFKRMYYKTGSHGEPLCRKCAEWSGPPVKYKNKPIGRNQICPCGSGLKFKKCCMLVGIREIEKDDDETN